MKFTHTENIGKRMLIGGLTGAAAYIFFTIALGWSTSVAIGLSVFVTVAGRLAYEKISK